MKCCESYVKEVDGQPRQEILPSLRIALAVIDLTHLPDEQAETEAKRLSSADARQLYDLANAPLMRATLVKLAARRSCLYPEFPSHHRRRLVAGDFLQGTCCAL